MADDIADGIYFSLPEATYHTLPRLSASGISNLMVSPATFWARSWMNPDKEEEKEPTHAQILGRAYDVAFLEPDRFGELFCRLVDPEDFELSTHAAIKAELKARGEPQTKDGEGVLDAAYRLRELGYSEPLYHIAKAAQDDDVAQTGRTPIRGDYFDHVVTDAERLHADETIEQLVAGGFAQVTILWTDDAGIRWKSRLDYLSPEAIIDLKSFENGSGKPVDRCIADAVRFNRYYIQAVIYWQAIERLRASADVQRETGLWEGPGQIATKEHQQLIGKLCQGDNGPLEFWWVFIEKAGIPNILARQFRMTADPHPHHLYQAPDAESREAFRLKMQRPARLFEKARLEIENAVRTYRAAMDVWGTEAPWGSLQPVGEIGDEDFAPFWLEE